MMMQRAGGRGVRLTNHRLLSMSRCLTSLLTANQSRAAACLVSQSRVAAASAAVGHAACRGLASNAKPRTESRDRSRQPFQPPEFNANQLDDKQFVQRLRENVAARLLSINIDHLLSLHEMTKAGNLSTASELQRIAASLPNDVHPSTPVGDMSKARAIYVNEKQTLSTLPADGVVRRHNRPVDAVELLSSEVPTALVVSANYATKRLQRQGPQAIAAELAASQATGRPTKTPLHHPLADARAPPKARRRSGFGHLRTEQLAMGAGPRSYYLGGPLAHLERALVDLAIDRLTGPGGAGMALVSVPDVLPRALIEACGFATTGERNQVFHLCSGKTGSRPVAQCLSGTAEMSLAGFCAGRVINVNEDDNAVGGGDMSESCLRGVSEEEAGRRAEDAADALGLCAASRCFRQEVSHQSQPLFRVHQFTKVEMFCLTEPLAAASDAMFDQIVRLQIAFFTELGLRFRVLEMPTSELGNCAHRKVDIEAWLPGEQQYGEVSSASNCTDYQSKRLNIRWRCADGKLRFAHTLNGTACAIPRTIKALVETYQNKDGTIDLPEVLWSYMNGVKQLNSKMPYPRWSCLLK